MSVIPLLSVTTIMILLLYSDGTEVVVKVFAKHDPSVVVNHHERRLQGKTIIIGGWVTMTTG